jgi:nicotinamidase-related amidase
MKSQDIQILFADLQVEIVARSKTNPPSALAASAAVLAEVASLLEIPTLFTVVPEGGKKPNLVPELAGYATSENTFMRTSASPWVDNRTVKAMEANHRKTLVIAGFATEVVTLHTVLGAIEAGYGAVVPVDANGGMSGATEAAAIRQIERAGGVTTSVVTLVTTLAPDFSKSPGTDTFKALQKLRLA